MLGQEGKKVVIKGAQAQEVRAALARALSGRPNDRERKTAETTRTARKIYRIEWR